MGRVDQRLFKRTARKAVTLTLSTGLVLVLVFVLGLTACSNSGNPPSDTNEVDRAASLIDQKQFSEAIYVLTEHLKTMPGDAHARVLLASAYASRAGIELSSYTSFGVELSKWDQIDKLVPVQDTGDVLGEISMIANASVKIELIIGAFEALPAPQGPEGIDDVNKAIDVLNEAGKISAGPSLYRAMLKTVGFRYNLLHKYTLQSSVACEVANGDLSKWFTSTGGDLSDILNDVAGGLSDPASVDRVQAISSQLTTDVSLVATILALPQQGTNFELPPAIQAIYGKCTP